MGNPTLVTIGPISQHGWALGGVLGVSVCALASANATCGIDSSNSMNARIGRNGWSNVARLALLLGVSLFLGCGSSNSNGTFEEVSYDDLEGYLPAFEGSLTFNEDIAPIAINHCAACHRPGQSAPFSLLTYEDFKKRAKRIAAVTGERIMPPWQPEPGHGEFLGERRLSVDEIGTIRQWAAEGAAEGSPDDRPTPKKWPKSWQMGQPQLVVELPEPYTLPAEGPDVTRCFVIPATVTENRFIKAVEFRPGDPKVVYHAQLTVDYSPASRRRDETDPEPGFDLSSDPKASFFPNGPFFVWTPAKAPFETPREVSWRLAPGSDLVLQLRMRPSGKPEEIQPSIGIRFTEEPPTRFSMTLVLRSETIDIPAGEKEYVVNDSYVLPVAVDAWSVYPHAHHLAKQIKVFATLPDDRRKWLIHIEDWDYDQQEEYRLAKPMLLPAGTTISMRFTFDNTADNKRNPNKQPQRVRYGRTTDHEMAEVAIQVAAFTSSDFVILHQDFAAKNRGTIVAGLEHAIEIDPADAVAHNDLGMAKMFEGKTDEAAEHFAAALAARPDFAEAHTNQGILLQMQGKLDEARAHIERAVELAPDDDNARLHLGILCQREEKVAEAIENYEHALRLNPGQVEAHNNLGIIYINQKNMDAAKEHFQRAVDIMPNNALAHNNLGMVLAGAGNLAESQLQFQFALAIRPDYEDARRNLERVRELLRRQRKP